jgi:glutamyl-tRNA reductase
MGLVNGHSERLVNAVIQASKRIKTETKISTGATSVAFAAVQYILQNVSNISQKNILLFGTGKIGRNTCENLVKHTQNDHIVLINRTEEKATAMAKKFPVQVKPYGQLTTVLRDTDLLVVATGAQRHTLTADMLYSNRPLLILDLSMPRNVDPSIGELEHVQLIHLDELSQITNASINERKKYLPQAEEILEHVKNEFLEWLEHRKFAPTLKAIKEKLLQANHQESEGLPREEAAYMAQKITSHVAAYLKENPNQAPATLALLEDIFQLREEHI